MRYPPRNSLAMYEDCQITGHSLDSSKTKVLAIKSNTLKRHIKEVIEIRLRKPSLNRDNGFELTNLTAATPVWLRRALVNIHIFIVNDEVRLS